MSGLRTEMAIRFAEALIASGEYKDTYNPVINKNKNDYIADDAVDLADALESRLAIPHESNGTPSNIIALQPAKA